MGVRQNQLIGGHKEGVIGGFVFGVVSVGLFHRVHQLPVLGSVQLRGDPRMAAAQHQGQAFHFLGDQQDEVVDSPFEVAPLRTPQQFKIRVAGQHGFESIEQGDQGVDALFLNDLIAAGKNGVPGGLQPVNQCRMSIDQTAQRGGPFRVGIVERCFGTQIYGEAAHRFGQQQPPGAIVQQKREEAVIERVEQGAAREQFQI